MPKGIPLWPKCPKCRRGMWGENRPDHGTFRTGGIESKISRSKHQGHGDGGRGFYGHRGEVECRDCGYKWFSTHPASGRVDCSGGDRCTHGKAAA